jgi:hypothetical protein
VDWGHFLSHKRVVAVRTLCALEQTAWRDVYPMDYYRTRVDRGVTITNNKDRQLINNGGEGGVTLVAEEAEQSALCLSERC